MLTALIVVSAVALVLLVLVVPLLVYKSQHPYTPDDVKKKQEDFKTRSRPGLLGDIGEQLAPIWPEFAAKYNFRDARFIGKPIDFRVFDGLEEGEAISKIVFVEVKTGDSQLTPRERRVRDAIQEKKVEFEIIRPDLRPTEVT